MEQKNQCYVSEDEHGPIWSFLADTACDEVACHLRPMHALALFTSYFEAKFVDDIFQDRVKHLVNKQGVSIKEASRLLQPLRKVAIQDYVEEAMSYFRDKLPAAIRDAFTSLFFESALHAQSTLSGKILYRADAPDEIFPFARVHDQKQAIKQVARVSTHAAKKRMNARGKGRKRLEPVKVERDIVKALQSLRTDNERVNKAAVARRLNLGSAHSRTQALKNQLKTCNLNWEVLLRKSEVKAKI